MRAAPSPPSAPSPPAPTGLGWLLLIDPAGRPGAENMAVDQALLDEVERRGDIAYLRLYRWSPPCLSFGRNEPALSRYDRPAIDRLGIDVVRRPTGGRAVWHDDEVTYAVAAPVAAFGCLRHSYREIHRRLARALCGMGAEAMLAPSEARPGALAGGACFTQPVGGEVLIRERKVVGSAQLRQGDAFLQHGAILLGGSQDLVARVSRQRAAPVRAGSLSEALGRRVTFEEVASAIVNTWLADGEAWTGEEVESFPHAPLAVYSDPSWTWRR